MRRDVQEIVKMTPQEKQVMMFSATLPKDLRVVCKKFMQDVRFSGAQATAPLTFVLERQLLMAAAAAAAKLLPLLLTNDF
ncbi:unnamed protein product [Gongylonema pulchrum]|uniref:Helicase C-terminal domain-containing protein n=1 Tax=Gongylonema pulchrum TaxID=637853 RepID=A0A183D7J7_9BILA|nr:unnamed protein product [Gongylonema pulchrum]